MTPRAAASKSPASLLGDAGAPAEAMTFCTVKIPPSPASPNRDTGYSLFLHSRSRLDTHCRDG